MLLPTAMNTGWGIDFRSLSRTPAMAPNTPKIAPEAPAPTARGWKVSVATLPARPERK